MYGCAAEKACRCQKIWGCGNLTIIDRASLDCPEPVLAGTLANNEMMPPKREVITEVYFANSMSALGTIFFPIIDRPSKPVADLRRRVWPR